MAENFEQVETPPEPTASAEKADDILCVACGAPVTGLQPDGVCPACGARVALSQRDDRLGHASPFWVLKLSQATTLLFYLACLGSVSAIARAFEASAPRWLSQVNLQAYTVLSLLTWAAIILAATPEYVAAGRFRFRGYAWLLRACATISVMTIRFVLPIFPSGFNVVLIVVAVAWCVTYVLLYVHLRRLARRIPDQALYEQTPIALVAMLVALIVTDLLSTLTITYWPRLPNLSSKLANIIQAIALAYNAVILARYSTTLTRSANEAMSNYLSEKAS